MKGRKIISLVLSLVMLLSLAIVPTSAAEAEDGKTFEDVQEHWGKGSVERWAGYGVLKGDETGAFNPDKSMTRAEFATMLVNLMGYTEQAENTFADVPADAWYADAILKLAAAGVMQGDGVNANPNATISREETAVLLCRAMNITPSATASVDFADAGSVASWAQDAVAALVERGMIQGMGDNQFAPTLDITRASVAKMVDNMVAVYVVDDAQEITGDIKGVVIVAAAADVTIKDANLAENLIVAPKAADATVALTGKTVAKDVIVSGSGAAVKVGEDAKAASVVADAPKAEVSVAGTVSEVKSTAAAEASSLTVEKGAKVDTVVTDAPKGSVAVNAPVKSIEAGENAAEGSVEIAKGVTVDTLKTDAPIKVDNQGTVKKAEVNTSDVVIDGNAPKEMEVPKDVEKPTNSKGEEVKEPSTGGGGSTGGNDGPSTPSHSYKYKVSIVKVGNGTVSVTPANADEASEVTIVATPDEGWKLSKLELTTKPTDSTVTISGNKFTPDKEGTYVVTATFVQPLSKFDVAVFADGTVAFNWLKNSMGFSITQEQYDTMFGAIDGNHPWLFIAGKKGDGTGGIDTDNITITVNDADQTPTWGASGSVKTSNVFALYVNDSGAGGTDKLGFTGDAGTIKVSVEYEGVTYTASCEYKAPNVGTTYTLTFTDPVGGNKDIKYIVAENGSQNAPAALTRVGYTFAGWKLGESTPVEANGAISNVTANATYTAQWIENTYTIKFDDGTDDVITGSMSDMTDVKYTEVKTLTENAFVRAGYHFVGWATTQELATAGTVAYADKASVSKLAPSGNVTLYAVWEVNKVGALSATASTKWTGTDGIAGGVTGGTGTLVLDPNKELDLSGVLALKQAEVETKNGEAPVYVTIDLTDKDFVFDSIERKVTFAGGTTTDDTVNFNGSGNTIYGESGRYAILDNTMYLKFGTTYAAKDADGVWALIHPGDMSETVTFKQGSEVVATATYTLAFNKLTVSTPVEELEKELTNASQAVTATSLVIPEGKTLTVPAGKTLIAASITNKGNLVVEGTLQDYWKVTGDVTVQSAGALKWDGGTLVGEGGHLTLESGSFTLTADGIKVTGYELAGEATITDVSDAPFIICEGETFTVSSGKLTVDGTAKGKVALNLEGAGSQLVVLAGAELAIAADSKIVVGNTAVVTVKGTLQDASGEEAGLGIVDSKWIRIEPTTTEGNTIYTGAATVSE